MAAGQQLVDQHQVDLLLTVHLDLLQMELLDLLQMELLADLLLVEHQHLADHLQLVDLQLVQ